MGNTVKTRNVVKEFPNYGTFSTYLKQIGTGVHTEETEEFIEFSDRGRDKSNTCEHHREREYWPEQTSCQHRYRRYKQDDVVDTWFDFCPNPTQPLVSRDSDVEFIFRKERAITDILAGGARAIIDIPLFIGELKDTGKLFSTLLKGAKDFQKIRGYVRRAQELSAKLKSGRWAESQRDKLLLSWYRNYWKAGRLTLKSAGDANLWWKFGLEPLTSDLPTLWRCLNGTEISIKRVATPNQKIRSDFTVGPHVMLADVTGGDKVIVKEPIWTKTGSPAIHTAMEVGKAPLSSKRYRYTRHRYTAYGTLVAPQLSGYDAILRGLRLGAGSPISVAWELLNYSFIYDRFVNIGEFLRATDRRLNALDLGLEFKDGIWESHWSSVVETVPWYTFSGSTLTCLGKTAGATYWRDSHRFRWAGWRNISGGVDYQRRKLPDTRPQVFLRKGPLTKWFHWSTDLGLLAKFL